MNRKRTMDRQRILVIGLGIVLLILIMIVARQGIKKLTAKAVTTGEGITYIENKENADIQEIETRIQRLEAKDQISEEDMANRTPKALFVNSVVMGDSITEGFAAYDVLAASSVIADIGVELIDLGDEIEKVENLNPQVIFLAYGNNDIEATNGNTELFETQYKKALAEIQDAVPDARIFINGILPVSSSVLDARPWYNNIDAYNEVLRSICDEKNLTYIDNSGIVSEDLFEQDGIHFQSAFYPLWAQNMAEVAAL